MNIYMMIGYSGCGKTTYAKRLAEEKNADIFCADEIAKQNHRLGMTFRQNVDALEKTKFDIIYKGIINNKNIVLDGNFLSVKSRKSVISIIRFIQNKHIEYLKKNPNYVKIAMRSGRKINININVIAIHINNEWDECAKHRVERDGTDWKNEKDIYDHKDIPMISEGFYSIKTIHNDYEEVNNG